MRGIIDRFEGDIVIVEIEGETQHFPKDIFPFEAKSGDVVLILGNKVKVQIDETEKLRKEIEGLMEEVWED